MNYPNLKKNISSLRVKFALGFSLLYTFFLATALILVYVSFANFRKDEFYKRLKDKALTTFKFLIEVEQIDHDLLQVIDKNTLNSLNDEKVIIYKDSTIIYSSIDDRNIRHVPELFSHARTNGEYFTTEGRNEVVAFFIQQRSDKYIILASAYDKYGRTKMAFLKWIMIAVFCSGLVMGWMSTYFFVKKVIHPLEVLKKSLKYINYNNLDARLSEKGQGEEVNRLSATFNQMLAQLQQAFSFQRDFVHYASHELRTPLTTMISLTENAMNRQLTQEELNTLLKALFQEEKNLANITNSLLILSDNQNGLSEPDYPQLRLDELVFRSVEILKNIFPDAEIAINIEGELTNENALLINANEPLILMAFNNLLKNAIQNSSDNKARVILSSRENIKEISFQNAGSAFSNNENERIFTPFYRASNAGAVKGDGLGLPLVKQIIQLHNASIKYSYKDGFNEFKIVFQKSIN